MGRAAAAVEIAVGFIKDQGDALVAGQIKEGLHQFGGVFDAAGVVGRDQRNRTGARGDQGGGRLGIGQQIAAGGQRHGGDAGHVQPHFVVEIPRGWQDHLIPLIAQHGNRGGKGLIAAGGDADLFGLHGACVMRCGLCGQFGPQFRQAQHWPVKMRLIIGQRNICHRLTQGRRRRIDGRGLADVDQRAICGERHALQPTAGLHHGGREGGGGACQGHVRLMDESAEEYLRPKRRRRGVSPCRDRVRHIAGPCPMGRKSMCPG